MKIRAALVVMFEEELNDVHVCVTMMKAVATTTSSENSYWQALCRIQKGKSGPKYQVL